MRVFVSVIYSKCSVANVKTFIVAAARCDVTVNTNTNTMRIAYKLMKCSVLINIQDLYICEDQITLRNFIEFYIRLVSNYSGQRFAYICLMNRLFWLQLANFGMLAHMNVLRLFASDVYQIIIFS
ncbi:Imidazole glycerol phosphate synthase subunit HisH [Trichinella spiralis]|uniref:Imidazole glycerol phosphate synthase subunit HisH n=1 Tax=Trichinella spiralis TaxID=6334 RepID=A0ABR3KAN5_TRISP